MNLDSATGIIRLAAIGMLMSHLTVAAQSTPRIVTGEEAAKQFVYEGKAVHPFCLRFPLEASSRSRPNTLAECTAADVGPSIDTYGFLIVRDARDQRAAYRVLAKKGDDFLIASEVQYGGTGQFSALFWAHLDDTQLRIVREEPGGDRCGGGLSDYQLDGLALRFSMDATTPDILRLAGVPMVADRLIFQLRFSSLDCEGEAQFRYDLRSEERRLISLRLNSKDEYSEAAARSRTKPGGPQDCWDGLVRERANAGKMTLTVRELRRFGRQFVAKCLTP